MVSFRLRDSFVRLCCLFSRVMCRSLNAETGTWLKTSPCVGERLKVPNSQPPVTDAPPLMLPRRPQRHIAVAAAAATAAVSKFPQVSVFTVPGVYLSPYILLPLPLGQSR